MKNALANIQKVNQHHNKEKKSYEHTPSEAWFPSFGLLKVKEHS